MEERAASAGDANAPNVGRGSLKAVVNVKPILWKRARFVKLEASKPLAHLLMPAVEEPVRWVVCDLHQHLKDFVVERIDDGDVDRQIGSSQAERARGIVRAGI